MTINDPTEINVAPGYKNPSQERRISALQSQGVEDLLIENVYVILLFSNIKKYKFNQYLLLKFTFFELLLAYI